MYRALHSASKLLAIAGGTVLFAIIIMTCLSIVGRELNALAHADWLQSMTPGLSRWLLDDFGIGEIKGSYEITESGMAFVIFSFLPITQITAGHAVVDILTNALPRRVDRFLRAAAEVLFALALCLIAAQLYGGMMTKLNTGQTTLHLEYPVWWGYAAGLVGAVLAAIVATFLAGARVAEIATGEQLLPVEPGAEH